MSVSIKVLYGTNIKSIGSAFVDKKNFVSNGIIISVKNSGTKLICTISLKAGKNLKGTSSSEKLNGTTNSDIFYGGKGNDTITGKNGRDVVVYDKTAWGKDVIAKTAGRMTLLFKDLKSADLTQKTSGKNLIITRKSDKNQTITVKNYATDTHNIVFASGMTAFEKYLKASTPTTKQTSAARNEVWKKAGLASA